MADVQRGERIKAAREARHLTQQAVVDLIEDEARKLPKDDDLRRRLEDQGEPPISLRGYQSWQAGGGIEWDKAKLLAKVLHVQVDWIFNGEDEPQPTPDLFMPAITGELAQILKAIKDQLAQQTEVLNEIRSLLGQQREIKQATDEMSDLMRAVLEGPLGDVGDPAGTPKAKAPARKSRAAARAPR